MFYSIFLRCPPHKANPDAQAAERQASADAGVGGGGDAGAVADSSATVLRYYVWLLYGGTSAIAALTLGALAYFGAVLDPRRRGAGRGGADGPRLLAEVADPETD